ncbi:MAG TPA: patatin-like phospholipase family protein [Microbacterium sp.]|nr:patatin-like phospholipase family protein [Microbacterium sp.]
MPGDPVLQVVLDRIAAGSRPGVRRDEHVVCLAVEGGAMRGSVSAGMCTALEALGLIPAFDRIYGCSAGALNGAFTAAGQASSGATLYEDSANRRYIDVRRLARGEPAVNLDLLFDELLDRRRPLSSEGLAAGPDLRTLAVSLRTRELHVLADLRDHDTALNAVRASCSVPLLSGGPHRFRGELLVDGGFLESIPYRAALREGATHVLVLRSCAASHRLPQYRRTTGLAMRVADRTVASLLKARPERYNDEADELETLASHPAGHPSVTQVTVQRGLRLLGHVDTDLTQIRTCVRLGMSAIASLVTSDARPLGVAA